ncbi:MAG: hypothetical protein QXO15_03410 [Nitrososphaerota archaeon]
MEVMALRIDGFLVDVFCPSEMNLDVEVDASKLSWPEYNELIDELSEILSEIDRKYSVRSDLVRGRSLRARYRRITASDKSRKIRFSPFPSHYSNVLSNTRAYVYELVSECCLTLETVGNRKVFLLTKPMAPFFIEAIEGINEEVIEPLKKRIEEFRESDDYFRIERCLSNHGVDPAPLKINPFSIGRFRVDVVPVNLSYDVSEDEFYARERREEALKGLEMLRRQIEFAQRKYALNIISDITERILSIAGKMEKRGSKVRYATSRVKSLIEMCRSLGLNDVVDRVLNPLLEICVAPPYKRSELAKKLFGRENLSEAIKEELDKIMKSLTTTKNEGKN